MLHLTNPLNPLVAACVLSGAFCLATGAAAQAPPLTISPHHQTGNTFTDEESTWDRVPVDALFMTEPYNHEPSGIRIGRGSYVPDYVEVEPFRNVSIHRLQPMEHYGYFVSPDEKVVVIDPSRHVVRVIIR